MVIAVKVTIRNRQAIDNINQRSLQLPKEIANAGFEYVKLLQRNLRLRLTQNKNIDLGSAWRSIQARRKKLISTLSMSQEAIWLDRMEPHFVPLIRGSRIFQWAMRKGNKGVRKIAERGGVIWVAPHPFYNDVADATLSRLPRILQRRADKAMRKGG